MSSIELVSILCKAFRIGEDPRLDDKPSKHFYHFVLLRDSDFLQEIYNICIQHLFKTWKDMRGHEGDFDVVITATEKQVNFALAPPDSPQTHTIDEFKNNLPNWDQIKTHFLKEIEKKEGYNQKPAIKELTRYLRPQITSMIEKQRIDYITKGEVFSGNSSNNIFAFLAKFFNGNF